jgi:hypothetical protein|tara:strand:- start:468 stop:716 length:249 start_codon:yes stop_codon:yes gene_type:complete
MSRTKGIKAGANWFKNLLKKESAGKATLAYKDDTINKVFPSKGSTAKEEYLRKTKKARTESKTKEPWEKMGISKKEYDDLPF